MIRGDTEGARAIETQMRRRLDANPALARERWTTTVDTAVLELGLGDAARALELIAPVLATLMDDPLGPAATCTLFALGVEVYLALGRSDDAATLLETWRPRLVKADARWIDAEIDRAEALVLAASGDIDGASLAADRAVAAADGSDFAYVQARVLLTAGEVRRRARQKARAREALESAAVIVQPARSSVVDRADARPACPRRAEAAIRSASDRDRASRRRTRQPRVGGIARSPTPCS